jgi:tetraacyldisaccharide 4'-kinase
MQLAIGATYRLTTPTEQRDLSEFKGDRLLAAAGIGNPRRFFRMLHAAGLEFTEMPLPDHFPFRQNPFTETDAAAILITEKDAVKCKALADPRVWVVPVKAEIDPLLVDFFVNTINKIQLQLQAQSQEKS